MCKRDYTTGAQGEVNPAAEAKDGSPVASGVGQDLFKLVAETAVLQGYLSIEGFTNLMEVCEREEIR